MKKMFNKLSMVALFAAMVMFVVLTGCNDKKGNVSSSNTKASANSYSGADLTGDTSSSNTEASAEDDSAMSSRDQIDAFLKDYEKFVEKAEEAAAEGKLSSVMSLQAEAVKLAEKSEELEDMSEWNGDDSEKYLRLTNRYTEAMLRLSNSIDSIIDSMDSMDDLLDGLL